MLYRNGLGAVQRIFPVKYDDRRDAFQRHDLLESIAVGGRAAFRLPFAACFFHHLRLCADGTICHSQEDAGFDRL